MLAPWSLLRKQFFSSDFPVVPMCVRSLFQLSQCLYLSIVMLGIAFEALNPWTGTREVSTVWLSLSPVLCEWVLLAIIQSHVM